jgi:PAS domain S-box-containing protein
MGEKRTSANSTDDLVELAENSPAMLWRGDATGRCVYLSASMREFWGLRADECTTFEWSSSLLPEDHDKVFGPFSLGMTNRQPFSCEGRYRRADGEVRVLRTKAKPYFDANGEFAGQIGVNEDITELRRAEAGLTAAVHQHQSVADRLKLATAISGLAMSEHDATLRYTWAHNVTGQPIGKLPSELVGSVVGERLEQILRRTIVSGEPQSEELALTVDESPLWVELQTSPLARADGEVGVIASALDVTTRKLNEQKLGLLAGELGHRIKNVFSLVQAIVRQSARSTDVPGEFVAMLEARINALARAQDTLVSRADDRVSLPSLVREHLSHLTGVEISGNDVSIPGRLAPYFALAVHELGTNALKYGSLSCPGGSVLLQWTLDADGALSMSWRESGGPVVAHSDRKGLGTALLTSIFCAATGGESELDHLDHGLCWTARVPLASKVDLRPGTGVA